MFRYDTRKFYNILYIASWKHIHYETYYQLFTHLLLWENSAVHNMSHRTVRNSAFLWITVMNRKQLITVCTQKPHVGLKQSWIFSIRVLSGDSDGVFTNTVGTCSITTWLTLKFTCFHNAHVTVSLTKIYAIEILQPSLCYSLMTNTSCELGHMILTSTWVPTLLSEYQILSKYSPNISICFSPTIMVCTW